MKEEIGKGVLTEDFTSERDLEDAIVKNPEGFEIGLRILKHQVPAGSGIVDILAVDRKGTLTVIELKIAEDDHALLQGLEYVDWVNRNADRIPDLYVPQGSALPINIDTVPRLVLVAPSFSDTLEVSAKYIDGSYVDLGLREFRVVDLPVSITPENTHLIIFNEIELRPVDRPPEQPWTVEDYINWITDPDVRKVCEDTRNKIMNLGDGIECNAKQAGYFAFQFKGRNIATINPYRKHFFLNVKEDGDWKPNKIIHAGDLSESVFEKIAKAYVNLGGTPK
jgi:predicted transport protein